MNKMLIAALQYAEMGWYVLPIRPKSKIPLISSWQKDASNDPEKIKEWWNKYPDANIGINCGLSGFFVIDIDCKDNKRGPEILSNWEDEHGKLPETVTQHTPSGGEHRLYKLPQDFIVKNHVDLLPGIDIRAEAGQIVVEPSINNDSMQYVWELSSHPSEIPIVECSTAFLELIKSKQNNKKSNQIVLSEISTGSRNTSIFRMLCSLREKGFNKEQLLSAAISINATLDNPLSDSELKTIVSSCDNYRISGKKYSLPGCDLKEFELNENWHISFDGISYNKSTKDGDMLIPFAYAPVIPIECTENLSNNQEFYELNYISNNKWKKTRVSRDEMMDTKKIIRLAEIGIPINSINSKMMIKFFDDFISLNKLPIKYALDHCGWHEDGKRKVFCYGRKVIGTTDNYIFDPNEDTNIEAISALTNGGSREESINLIKEVSKHPSIMMGIMHSCAAPILGVLGVQNFFVDYYGKTSTGKTTALKVISSLWGNPEQTSGLINSWNTTKVFPERYAAAMNEIPIFFDESQLCPNGVLDKTIYILANGRGKGRGSLKSIQTTRYWRTVIFSTGEKDLSTATTFSGAKARIISYVGSPFSSTVSEDYVRKIQQTATNNFGHIGPEFVNILRTIMDDPSILINSYRNYTESLTMTINNNKNIGMKNRLIEYFAASATAGYILNEYYDLKLDVMKTCEDALHCIINELDESGYGQKVFESLKGHILSNHELFDVDRSGMDTTDNKKVYQYAGKWQHSGSERTLAIIPSWFRDFCKKFEYDYDMALRSLFDEGYSLGDSQGKSTRMVHFSQIKAKQRCLVIKWPEEEA